MHATSTLSSHPVEATADEPRVGPQPHETIWALTNAVVPSSCLHLVAELGIADHLDDEPARVEELASGCGADPDALDRVLALLACHGVFRRDGRAYSHTPASRLLRSDEGMSMRAFPRMMALPLFSTVFSNLEHSIRTGAPAVETVEPKGFWGYLEDRPDEARIFGQAMSAKAAADVAAILGAYDFGRFDTVADIGGGRGHLLSAVLAAAPGTHGILFDLPSVIDALDIEHERLTTQAGDFFVDQLPGADLYVLMEVLHDWDDERCVAILSAIHRSAAPGARVAVIENILRDGEPDARGRTLDVIMLAVTGGRERTASELNELFEGAGWSDATVVETAGPLRIAEATAEAA
jgi:C-methyltransferase